MSETTKNQTLEERVKYLEEKVTKVNRRRGVRGLLMLIPIFMAFYYSFFAGYPFNVYENYQGLMMFSSLLVAVYVIIVGLDYLIHLIFFMKDK